MLRRSAGSGKMIKVVKLILDADASIKLSKISLIGELADAFVIVITKEVYEEQVVVGLKKGYPDAQRVDTLVKSKKIEVKDVQRIYADSRLGRGGEKRDRLLSFSRCRPDRFR